VRGRHSPPLEVIEHVRAVCTHARHAQWRGGHRHSAQCEVAAHQILRVVHQDAARVVELQRELRHVPAEHRFGIAVCEAVMHAAAAATSPTVREVGNAHAARLQRLPQQRGERQDIRPRCDDVSVREPAQQFTRPHQRRDSVEGVPRSVNVEEDGPPARVRAESLGGDVGRPLDLGVQSEPLVDV